MMCVVGCGNLTRSDDGVGVCVAKELQAFLLRHPQPDVAVFDAGTGGMDVMFQARGAHRLVIVDASTSGSEAGAIFRVPGSELASVPEPGYSLHDFRWQHALSAGRKIFGADFPSDVTVYLIEAANLSFGLNLSAPVVAAAARVTEEIKRELSAHPSVSAQWGNLHLSHELCDAHLAGVAAVALVARDAQVLIVPLIPGSPGGLLLKQRNSRGDRVIHAQDFFRVHSLPEDSESRPLSARWSEALAALVVSGLMDRVP